MTMYDDDMFSITAHFTQVCFLLVLCRWVSKLYFGLFLLLRLILGFALVVACFCNANLHPEANMMQFASAESECKSFVTCRAGERKYCDQYTVVGGRSPSSLSGL